MNPSPLSSPAVSICIPAFHRPVELRVAIESVLTQGVDEIEVLVGDNGGGDLESVVQALGDHRVLYVCHSRNLGMAGNWNALLDRARAPLVALLMDDDRWLPGYLPEVLSRFGRDRSLGVVFTNHVFEGSGPAWKRECLLPQGRYENFLLNLLKYQPICASAAVMRREVWEQVRPAPDLLTADLVLQIRAALAGAVFFYVDRPLVAYRVHGGQLSGSEERFRDDEVALWNSFGFNDSECEKLRTELLRRSLFSRAATSLKGASADEAWSYVATALALETGPLAVRESMIKVLASHPRLARAAAWGWDKLAGPHSVWTWWAQVERGRGWPRGVGSTGARSHLADNGPAQRHS
jgi:glycosyltransferase involved in cell wall biosynthesis